MFGMMNKIGRNLGKKATLLTLSAAAFAGLGMAPSAQAGERSKFDINFDIRIGDRHDRDRRQCEPVYQERTVKVWVPAQYRTVCDRQWIEPIYETRCERVYIEPVYEMRCEKVWVPERYEYRQSRRFDRSCGRFVEVAERVCVAPGHFEEVHKRVCVREGGFQEVHKKVCVREGRFQTVERQELVCEGHWEYRTERVRVG